MISHMKMNGLFPQSIAGKILLAGLFAWMPASTLSAQSRPVQQLAPDVYFYWGDEMQGKSANCLWVVFKDYVLAVDATYPWGEEEIIQEIRKPTPKPIRFLFDTHYH